MAQPFNGTLASPVPTQAGWRILAGLLEEVASGESLASMRATSRHDPATGCKEASRWGSGQGPSQGLPCFHGVKILRWQTGPVSCRAGPFPRAGQAGGVGAGKS